MTRLYYTPPSDEIFEEVKSKAIEIWGVYDDTYGYATEKINRIKDLKNVSDNFMYMVAMFDLSNQARLATIVSEDARRAVRDRIEDGGGGSLF